MSKSHSILSTVIFLVNSALYHLGLTRIGSLLSRVTNKMLSEEEVASDLCHRYFQAYDKVCHVLSQAEEELADWKSEDVDEPLSKSEVLYLVDQVEGLYKVQSWYPHDLFFQRRVRRLYTDILLYLKDYAPGFSEELKRQGLV